MRRFAFVPALLLTAVGLLALSGCGGKMNGKYVKPPEQEVWELKADKSWVCTVPESFGGIKADGKYEVAGNKVSFYWEYPTDLPPFQEGTLGSGTLTIKTLTIAADIVGQQDCTLVPGSGGPNGAGKYSRPVPEFGGEQAYTFKPDGTFVGPMSLEGKYDVSGNTVTLHTLFLGTSEAHTGTLKGDTLIVDTVEYKKQK